MTDERLMMAIDRLEHALARLESMEAAQRPDAAAAKARHARLRRSTQAAIARLDDLLGSAPAETAEPR